MVDSRSLVVSVIGGVRDEAEKTIAVAHPPPRHNARTNTEAPAQENPGNLRRLPLSPVTHQSQSPAPACALMAFSKACHVCLPHHPSAGT
jgi:hypothetical protein